MAQVNVKSGSGDIYIDPKKQYLIAVPEGEFGQIHGAIEDTVTNDTIMFDVKGTDISQYKVRIFSHNFCCDNKSIRGVVPDGHYIMLIKGDGKGGGELAAGIRIGGGPSTNEVDNGDELRGGNKDFSNTIVIQTSDGKIHRIAKPELYREHDNHKEPWDPNVSKLDTLAKVGLGAQIPQDLAKEVLALKEALGGDEAATKAAIEATLLRIKTETKVEVQLQQ